MRPESADELRALVETVDTLRAPGGCPWDRAQTHRSLRPYLLEEAYETLEAIESGDPAQLREELGDLLLQVLMHSAIAAEGGEAGFDVGDVAATTREKMVGRHPHVFGDAEVSGAADVVVSWERLKAREKGTRLSVLDGVPRTLPALAYALGLQKRPARLGFDATPSAAEAAALLQARLDELAVRPELTAPTAAPGNDWVVDTTPPAAAPPPAPGGHAAGPPPASTEVEDMVGDVLLAAVALARRLRVDPEHALRRRAAAEGDAFRAVERHARAAGLDLHDLTADDWRRLSAEVAPAV